MTCAVERLTTCSSPIRRRWRQSSQCAYVPSDFVCSSFRTRDTRTLSSSPLQKTGGYGTSWHFRTVFFYLLEGWRAATPSAALLDYVGSIPLSSDLNGILTPTSNIRMHTLIHQQKREIRRADACSYLHSSRAFYNRVRDYVVIAQLIFPFLFPNGVFSEYDHFSRSGGCCSIRDTQWVFGTRLPAGSFDGFLHSG